MTPALPVYTFQGLHVRSGVALHERELTGAVGPVDVEIVLGDPAPVGEAPAPGEPVAELVSGGKRFYSVTRLADGTYLLRVHGVCDFAIDAPGSVVRCHPDPGIDIGCLPILLRGTVIAFLVGLRGSLPLHASAVEDGGTVVAFAGPSGLGKSTTAALLCAAGARLVTDDVLRIEAPEVGWVRCARGSSELRLRPAAAGLVERFPVPPPVRLVADGRIALSPRGTDRDWLRLGAVVVPCSASPSSGLELRRLPATEALFSLARFPRIAAWRGPEVMSAHFQILSGLCAAVPVFHAIVPRGIDGRELRGALAGEVLGARV